MFIRDFKPSDLDDVIRIEFNSFDDPYPVDIILQLYNAGAGFLVSEISHNVVGYVIFWIKDGMGHIIVIAVEDKYRDMQIGSLLLDRAIYIFKKNNINQIKLEVRKSNIRARRFYQKNGFVQVGEEEDYYGDGESAVIMQFSSYEC